MIPCLNPGAAYQAAKTEIDTAVERVLESGWYIMGPEVEAFEDELARYLGVDYAFGVASGTEALVLALKAARIGPGDEVITVSHTAVATVAAIELAGARPVCVDIEPGGYTIDPQDVARAITQGTKALIPVHLYGQPADMDPLLALARDHNLIIIEDCAQAAGATWNGQTVGSIGQLGCFSFYPTKNLAALGDGGAVVTSDKELARRIKQLRQYGWDEKRSSWITGHNSRLDELQAAVLRLRLNYLDEDNSARRKLAHQYASGLEGLGLALPEERIWTGHVFHLYVIALNRRDELKAALARAGVGSLIHYTPPVHLQPAYLGRVSNELPRTEAAAQRVLSLPMYPQLSEGEVSRVIEAIKKVLPELK